MNDNKTFLTILKVLLWQLNKGLRACDVKFSEFILDLPKKIANKYHFCVKLIVLLLQNILLKIITNKISHELKFQKVLNSNEHKVLRGIF